MESQKENGTIGNGNRAITKLKGEGTLNLKGFFRNTTTYGVSYLLFGLDDEAYSINGFAAEQFDTVAQELQGAEFQIAYSTAHSDRYNKDYIVLSNPVVLKLPEKQTKLSVVYTDKA